VHFPRMDQRVRLRAAHRRLARSPDPSRSLLEMNGESLSPGTKQASLQTLPTRYVVQRNAGKLTFQEEAPRSRRRPATARIAATRMIARCVLSPSSHAPTARPYRASGLDRSARPSKSASLPAINVGSVAEFRDAAVSRVRRAGSTQARRAIPAVH
jgi:hypothetical protein